MTKQTYNAKYKDYLNASFSTMDIHRKSKILAIPKVTIKVNSRKINNPSVVKSKIVASKNAVAQMKHAFLGKRNEQTRNIVNLKSIVGTHNKPVYSHIILAQNNNRVTLNTENLYTRNGFFVHSFAIAKSTKGGGFKNIKRALYKVDNTKINAKNR